MHRRPTRSWARSRWLCARPGCRSRWTAPRPSSPRRPPSGVDDQSGVYWAGRATLCGCLDDLERYDQLFLAWFGGQGLTPRPAARLAAPRRPGRPRAATATAPARAATTTVIRPLRPATEVLRHRDVADLSPRPSVPSWPPVRHAASRRAAPVLATPAGLAQGRDRRPAHAARGASRTVGEPARLRHRGRSTRTRRVVVLVDVSGSMGPYADSLLRWAHVVTSVNRARTEVFTVGTRLTRVTRAMRLRDGDKALEAAGRDRPRLVGRHPARRGAAGVPRPMGTARRRARRGRRHLQRRLGTRRQRPARGADAAAAPARAQGRLGQPAPGQAGLRAGAGRNRRRPPVR